MPNLLKKCFQKKKDNKKLEAEVKYEREGRKIKQNMAAGEL